MKVKLVCVFFQNCQSLRNHCTVLAAALTVFHCHTVTMSREGDSEETNGEMRWGLVVVRRGLRGGVGIGKPECRRETRRTSSDTHSPLHL